VVPISFLVGSRGGTPHAIQGLPPATESYALGWTPSGRALLVSTSGGCAAPPRNYSRFRRPARFSSIGSWANRSRSPLRARSLRDRSL